jgi:hypothetical protein
MQNDLDQKLLGMNSGIMWTWATDLRAKASYR